MKKILVLLGIVLTVSACDSEVDITKYPEAIQQCYNGIYYNTNNCNKSKTILKYCQCFTAKSTAIVEQTNQNIKYRGKGWDFLNWGVKAAGEKKLQAAANECAEKTGYTRVANCKKKNVPDTMDME